MTETPASTTTTRTTTTTNGRSTMDRIASATHAILRIGAGLLFMQHGAQKLFGLLGGFGGEPGATADLFSLMGLAGVLEFFGGALIVIGLLTRPVAFILVIEMIAAYFIAHAPQGGFPIQNGGELPLLFALVFLFLAANGSGPLAVDRLMGRSRAETHRTETSRTETRPAETTRTEPRRTESGRTEARPTETSRTDAGRSDVR